MRAAAGEADGVPDVAAGSAPATPAEAVEAEAARVAPKAKDWAAKAPSASDAASWDSTAIATAPESQAVVEALARARAATELPEAPEARFGASKPQAPFEAPEGCSGVAEAAM